MAYLEQEDPHLIEDLLTRKEFYWTKQWSNNKVKTTEIIPRFMLDAEIAKSNHLKLLGHQQFVENYFNPDTPYKRLHIKWSTGSGKTLAGLSIAMNFIRNYNIERELGYENIGSVFIMGFSERAFKNELLRYPEFGFLSRSERQRLDGYRRLAANGSKVDLDKYKDLIIRVKKRFSNRKGNGFFKFFGYKAFVNRIFICDSSININDLHEEQIRTAIAAGKIKYNEKLLAEFKNSLIICDEIHNVYNSSEKNNWGVALQSVLDVVESVRVVTLSATPLNNNPAEIVDLLNLLLPSTQRVYRDDFFVNDRELKPGALEKIAKLSTGRFSYLLDVNPKHYPRVINYGESLKEIPYLKFIRCVMSDFQWKTYSTVYTGSLSQDAQYLVDFALPNPENPDGIGIYQTSQVKKLLPTASQSFKTKYGMDYIDHKITGDICTYENIGKYSSKYYTMLTHLFEALKNAHGKVFIYHNVVHMSGVLFIEQLLLRNGFVSEYGSASDSTLCAVCGNTRKSHATQGGSDKASQEGESIATHDKYSVIRSDVTIKIVDNSPIATFKYTNDKSSLVCESQSRTLLDCNEDALNIFLTICKENNTLDIHVILLNNISKKFGQFLLKNRFEVTGRQDTRTKLTLVANTYKVGGANKTKFTPVRGHTFTPARFVMAHSDIDKSVMEHSLERFNSIDNVLGHNFMILVGSKILKESYDIKAIQNEYIMCKPDNIPTFIQIRGRAVRKGSHIGLPPEQHIVRMKIFTTCLPTKQDTGLDKGSYRLSYEEEKYKEKVASFQIIQQIEQVIHENAIDATINIDRIKQNAIGDNLAPLPYEPSIAKKFKREFTLDELNLSTFNVYHAKEEVAMCKVLIKRLFIELSSIWEYNDLLHACRNPPPNYESELNTRLISEESFSVALSQLQYINSQDYVEPFATRVTGGNALNGTRIVDYLDMNTDVYESLDSEESPKLGGTQQIASGGTRDYTGVVDSLFNTYDKQIMLPGGQLSAIVCIPSDKLYYVLFPMVNNVPNIDIELPYRIAKQEEVTRINMNSFIQTKRIDFDYDDKKKLFFRKYSDISVENMQNVICEYGTTFHIKFVEECIEYVFNVWTNPKLEKSDMHEFYFKMLYYYDLLSLVMFAHCCKPRVFAAYTAYANPVRARDIKLKALARYESREDLDVSPDDTSDLASSGVINLLKSTFNRTSNAWIPAEFRENYNATIAKSLSLFEGKKKRSSVVVKQPADLLPVGHYISKFPRIYHPTKGWDENPTYLQNEQEYLENNILIGFDERSPTGVHIRFKIRSPIHNIKKHKDSRQTEKGTVCKSKSKEYLQDMAKKLGAVLPDKVNVDDLCVVIRSKLIRMELIERIKKSNIKYFYFFYEQRPETV